jgi:hypothetical protein
MGAACAVPGVVSDGRGALGTHRSISDGFWGTVFQEMSSRLEGCKSPTPPMVNRVLTSPYLWWFDVFPVIGYVPRPLLKVLAFQTWQ